MIDPDEVDDVVGTLERVNEKMERLRSERDKLLKANRQLVKLVEAAEEILHQLDEESKEDAESNFRFEEHAYSFEEGWRPKDVVHEESLDLDMDLDPEDVDRQIREVREMMERIRTYKSEEPEGEG